MYIETVELLPSYLEGCQAGFLKKEEYFIVRRSQQWDLADPDDRIAAAFAFLTVLNYTMNGGD
jgi:hypothetical protein